MTPRDTVGGRGVRSVHLATVLDRRRLSPNFSRVTLGGAGLADFSVKGYDQWFRLFIPKPGSGPLELPGRHDEEDWYATYRVTAEDERPTMRYVTVRDHRSVRDGGLELDVDVVVHGEPGRQGSGPLSTWAQTAEAGDAVGLVDQGLIFRPEKATGYTVLLGDETALPAIARILSYLPREARGIAFVELPDPADRQALAAPAGFAVEWLGRTAERPGMTALAAARKALKSSAGAYVYGAGETRMTTELSKLLKGEMAWPKDSFTTVGYWHHAPPSSAYERKVAETAGSRV